MSQRVLIVIPTLNEAAHIETVFSELRPQLGADARVVVVDGGSTDGTRALVQIEGEGDERIALLDNPARFQSAGINLAVERFGDGFDVLVRCDAHSHYPATFLSDLLAALALTGADSVVVPMDATGLTCTGRAVAWVSDSLLGSGGSAHRGGQRSGFVDHGHHAAMRLTSFCGVGGYEPSFTHNEDAELDCRLRAAGGRIYLDASIRLTYVARPTLAALWQQYRKYGFGRSRTMRRHPESMRARQLAVPSFILANLACLILAHWSPILLLLPLAYALLLASSAVRLAMRKRSSCALLAGPAALTMHVAWTLGLIEGLLYVRERRWQADSK